MDTSQHPSLFWSYLNIQMCCPNRTAQTMQAQQIELGIFQAMRVYLTSLRPVHRHLQASPGSPAVERTNLSPFTKDSRARGPSMGLSNFWRPSLRGRVLCISHSFLCWYIYERAPPRLRAPTLPRWGPAGHSINVGRLRLGPFGAGLYVAATIIFKCGNPVT